jgi:hypothetical protein
MYAGVKCKKAEKVRNTFQAVIGFLTELDSKLYFRRNTILHILISLTSKENFADIFA